MPDVQPLSLLQVLQRLGKFTKITSTCTADDTYDHVTR